MIVKRIGSKYTRPQLNGHKLLYKGLRFWIFEVSKKFPFDGIEEYSNVVVYDCLNDCTMVDGVISKDGKVAGFIQYGQGGIDISGHDVVDFMKNALKQWKRLDKQF